MSDLLQENLNRAAERISRPTHPDFDHIIRRGERRRIILRTSTGLATLAIAFGGWSLGNAITQSEAPSNAPAQQTAPSSHSLAYSATGTSGNSDIFIARKDGSEAINLTSNPLDNLQPTWSPDGTKIAFSQEESAGSIFTIYVMRSDGSNVRQLVDGPGSEVQPTWSPEGRLIAYVKNTDGTPTINLVNEDGSNDHVLIDRGVVAEHPSWSPDGSQIAFASDVHNNREIFVVNADGSGLRRVTDDGATDTAPSWSPNGEKIAFVRATPDSDGELFVMNSDGSGVERLWPAANGDKRGFVISTTWTPGVEILFSSYSSGSGYSLRIIGADGTEARTLDVADVDPFGVDLRPDVISSGRTRATPEPRRDTSLKGSKEASLSEGFGRVA